MAMLLSRSPRRLLRLLKPETLLPRTLSPTMSPPSPPHFPAGHLPPAFGPMGWSSGLPQWQRALCTSSSDPPSSPGICDAGLTAVEGTASPDVVQVSLSPFRSMQDPWSPSPVRRRNHDEVHVVTPKPAQKGDSETDLDRKTIKIMTFNVWSKSMELSRRMTAIGDLIQHHTPDLICLQMSKLPVDSFGRYYAKGRELCTADVSIGGVTMVLVTSHLVTTPSSYFIPRGKSKTYMLWNSDERASQAKKCLRILRRLPNVIFCVDMNWDEKVDGSFPLWMHGGWVDAWGELKPYEDGWMYDTTANPMLLANKKLQKRLDRFVCRLADFEMDAIEMIGKQAVPGVSYVKDKTIAGVACKVILPVLPSDHFVLILTIARRQAGSASSDSEPETETETAKS